MSPKELASRREHGLCFNCEEKYHCGHKCSSRVHVLIAEKDDDPQEDTPALGPLPNPPDHPNPTTSQISFHSLAGHLAPETLLLVGYIGSQHMVILIYGGSNHNFIQESLALQLGLPTHTSPSLSVMVGNGQYFPCNRLCEAITILIQDISFTLDLYVLPLCGANLVLGVQ